MGVNTRSLGRRCKTLIINALNPDPGVTWAEPMLVSHVENLRTGMELHRRMARADNVILAVPKGSKVAYEGIPLAYVEPEYPNSVDQLVIKAVTGEENPEGVGIVGLHNIWSLGARGAASDVRSSKRSSPSAVTNTRATTSCATAPPSGSCCNSPTSGSRTATRWCAAARCAARASTGSTAASPKGPTAFS